MTLTTLSFRARTAVLAALCSTSLMLCACTMGGEPVHFDRYSLTQDVQPAAFQSGYDIELTLAAPLTQGGVVLQMSDVSLRPARNYRYSAELDNELSVLFADRLLSSDKAMMLRDFKIRIFVSKFQGTMDGHALTAMSLRVLDAQDQCVYENSCSEDSTMKEDGYDALVSELKASYIRMCDKVLADLPDLTAPKSRQAKPANQEKQAKPAKQEKA